MNRPPITPEEHERRRAAVEAGRASGKDVLFIAKELGLLRSVLEHWIRIEERRAIIMACLSDGLTLEQIGTKMDISGHRVKQIISKHVPEAKTLRQQAKHRQT